jgi:hypothetical protein
MPSSPLPPLSGERIFYHAPSTSLSVLAGAGYYSRRVFEKDFVLTPALCSPSLVARREHWHVPLPGAETLE